ncbi:hypothetical protein HKX48_001362 [Thoreauomyces humboldtii]|nr:hypothetical protein HKX48_001362 [Thoreauomyces humboldtii]
MTKKPSQSIKALKERPAAVMVRKEMANEGRIRKILAGNLEPFIAASGSGKSSSDIKELLIRYLTRKVTDTGNSTNIFQISYYYGALSGGRGRLYAAEAVGLQSMQRDVRNAICGEYYHDIDIVNCYPTMIWHLVKQAGFECPDLLAYIQDRKASLLRLGTTKEDFLAALLTEPKRPNNKALVPIHETVYTRLVPLLKEQDQWRELWTTTQSKEKEWNADGSFLSLVCCDLEDACLRVLIEALEKKEFVVGTLMFDGFLVRRATPSLLATHLRQCEAAVEHQLGIVLRLAEKPLDTLLETDKLEEESVGGSLEVTLKSLPAYADLDPECLTSPDNLSLARLFIKLRGQVFLKHPSGVFFVLGKDNIWTKTDNLYKTRLRGELADVLLDYVKKIIQAVKATDADQKTVDLFLKAYADVKYIVRNEKARAVISDIESESPLREDLALLFLSRPHLWAFSDCVHDLNTNETRSIRPDDYIYSNTTYPLPRRSDPLIRARLDRFFSDIFATEEIKNFRLATLAQALRGELVDEIFMILKGETRNGKGTEDAIIQNTFGPMYYRSINRTCLTKESDGPDSANSQLYSCFGSRYISVPEMAQRDKILVAMIKQWTGSDPIAVRDLRGKVWTVKNTALICAQTNDNPLFDNLQSGLVKRVKMVEYPNEFGTVEDVNTNSDQEEGNEAETRHVIRQADETIKTDFGTAAYRDEFMLMLLEHYHKTFANGSFKLKFPSEVTQFTGEHLWKALAASSWLGNHYERTGRKQDRVEKPRLWKQYELSGGHINKVQFFKELEAVLGSALRSNGSVFYIGLRASATNPPADPNDYQPRTLPMPKVPDLPTP